MLEVPIIEQDFELTSKIETHMVPVEAGLTVDPCNGDGWIWYFYKRYLCETSLLGTDKYFIRLK